MSVEHRDGIHRPRAAIDADLAQAAETVARLLAELARARKAVGKLRLERTAARRRGG